MASGTPTPAERRKAQKTRRNVIILVVVCVCAGAGWYQYDKSHQVDPASKLITTKVTHADLVETVAATGSITPQTGAEVHIGSQITGTIKELKADIGTVLKANDAIAILNLPDLDAQVRQAKASLDSAVTKEQQTEAGVNLEETQTREGIVSAQAGVKSAQALYDEAVAAQKLTGVQTPTDIRKAQATLDAAKAALSTANSNLRQQQASGNLQIATANDSVTQNQATYNNDVLTVKRNEPLLAKGYIAQSVLDSAVAAQQVAASQLASAKENVDLVKASVDANLQTAKDAVSTAQQNQQSAVAALDAANAEPYNDQQKQQAVNSAKQAMYQANSALTNARANKIADTLKQQDVMQAQEAVRIARATYDYNLAQQDKSVIRTPIAATVINLAVQQGETLAAGLSSPTVIVVADLHRLQVDAYVDETDIGKIKLGQAANIVVDAFQKRTYKGIVTKIDKGSTIQQGVVTYDVTIKLTQKDIDDQKHRLLPDMTVNATFETGKLTNVLVVPSVAIKVSTKGSTVNVLTRVNGKAVVNPQKVTTGGNDETNTEIRKGLNEGDVVVLAGALPNAKGPNGPGPTSPFGPSSSKGSRGK